MQDIEKKIVIYLNGSCSKRLDRLSAIVSDIKLLIIVWSLAGLYFLCNGFEILALQLVFVFLLHTIFCEGILKYGAKFLSLERVRPYLAYPDEIRRVGINFSDKTSSFPSGHTAGMTGGLFMVYSAFPQTLLILILLGGVVALSRIHNGLHYPSDVLAGILLGITYGFVALQLTPYLIDLISSIR
ncbi:MAG: PAP2 family protein [uncultured bacterium]|nr:MAG: PAP2 family protein [uncultured bacterium]